MANLSGMTGFARVSGDHDGYQWVWEARSVNGRGLDARVKLPSELNPLETDIKKTVAKYLSRGNIQISLTLTASERDRTTYINEPLFDSLVSFIKAKDGNSNYAPLMRVDGVVSASSQGIAEADIADVSTKVLKSAEDLAIALRATRFDEGKALLPLFTHAITQMEALIQEAESLSTTQPAGLSVRLIEQIKALDIPALSEDRLAQEIALLASKVDVKEELDRLRAHCKQAKNLLGQGTPIGRKLDFLSQEFNRETNTLCAKSADIDLTRIGLEMKSVIEQFREQAANVE